jgi:Tol biopolymer transport system component/DNA-binding winged helix-turn-helix (wHTH) protein
VLRKARMSALPPAARAPRNWRIGRFRFDTSTRELSADGLIERLPVKTAAVLQRLAEHAGEVVARDQLIAEVWDGNAYTGSRALTQSVWKLRRLLDAAGDGEGAIKTISKSGYQLLLPALADGAASQAEDIEALPLRRRRRRPRAATARLGLLIAMLLAAIALIWWLQPRTPARIDSVGAAPTPLTMLDGVEEYPAYSADGQRLAYVASRAGSPARILISDLRHADQPPVEVRDDDFIVARPMWLGPQRLAYARARDGADCRVVALDLVTHQLDDLAACFYERNMPFVDASPDGRWLALARHHEGSAGVAIVLHSIADGGERLLTHPEGGLDDASISFSRSGKQIAFLRGSNIVGDVYVVDIGSGRETRLTHDQAPVGGLSWLSDDHAIAFNSARDGAFATWLIAPGGGQPRLFSRAETPVNLAPIPGQPNAIAASLHRFNDNIELLALKDGQKLSEIASNGRNLYAQACPDDGHVLFLSMRSGRIAMWAGDGRGGHLRQLNLPEGTPDPPGCAADSARFASTLRAPGASSDAILLGRLDRDDALQVLPQQASFNSAVWSLDQRSLVIASDRQADQTDRRAGGWDLWRYDLATQQFQRLTDDQGNFGREVRTASGLWLYYTRLGKPGLWRRSLDAAGRTQGVAEAITDQLGIEDWGNWQWHDGALWMVERGAERDRIVRRDERGGAPQIAFTLPPGYLRLYRSFSLTQAGVVIASVAGPRQADIVRLAAPAP